MTMLKLSTSAIRELIGAGICLGAIGVAVLVWGGSPDPPSVLPLVFLVIVIWLAIQFGRHAGFISTLLAAAALAYFVYKPIANFSMQDRTAAGYVAALLLGGIICSELLADPPEHGVFRK
jgi:K+-sensing histidine kinase KdpD